MPRITRQTRNEDVANVTVPIPADRLYTFAATRDGLKRYSATPLSDITALVVATLQSKDEDWADLAEHYIRWLEAAQQGDEAGPYFAVRQARQHLERFKEDRA